MNPLSESEVKRELKQRGQLLEEYLQTCLDRWPDIPLRLRNAMEYSLLAGGKRIRPVLCLVWAEHFGLKPEQILPFAAAIELIHTYSLIHDDLPAMDDDDLRRGRPSSHKRFDEATAILAGDGLLTNAFALACDTPLPPDRLLAAMLTLAKAAGSSGMVGGQLLDMEFTARNDISIEQIADMQARKTGAMLMAACVCGAILGGASQQDVNDAEIYGASLGRAFQIVDDLLDLTATTEALGKPAGSDVAKGKSTYPAKIGIEASRAIAETEVENAVSHIPPGKNQSFLSGLCQYILSRSA